MDKQLILSFALLVKWYNIHSLNIFQNSMPMDMYMNVLLYIDCSIRVCTVCSVRVYQTLTPPYAPAAFSSLQ